MAILNLSWIENFIHFNGGARAFVDLYVIILLYLFDFPWSELRSVKCVYGRQITLTN